MARVCGDKLTSVYPDASGAGHLGAIAFINGVQTAVRTRAPAWLLAEAGTCDLEQAGAILGVLTAHDFRPGLSALPGCDNFGACGAVIRGPAAAELGRQMSSAFWSIATVLSIPVWDAKVIGRLNPAPLND